MVSCSSSNLRPFTEELRKDQRWSDNQLQKIQFYVSKDVYLYRRHNNGESSIVDGKIVMKDGEKIEEVVIKRGTPGTLVYNPKFDRFGISFEKNGEEKFLMFGPQNGGKGTYMLLGKEWDNREGKVTYGDKVYRTNSSSAYAMLMVELEKVRKVEVKRKEAEGRTVMN